MDIRVWWIFSNSGDKFDKAVKNRIRYGKKFCLRKNSGTKYWK